MGGISEARRRELAAQALIELKVQFRLDAQIAARRAGSRLRRRFLDDIMVTASRLALAAGMAT